MTRLTDMIGRTVDDVDVVQGSNTCSITITMNDDIKFRFEAYGELTAYVLPEPDWVEIEL